MSLKQKSVSVTNEKGTETRENPEKGRLDDSAPLKKGLTDSMIEEDEFVLVWDAKSAHQGDPKGPDKSDEISGDPRILPENECKESVPIREEDADHRVRTIAAAGPGASPDEDDDEDGCDWSEISFGDDSKSNHSGYPGGKWQAISSNNLDTMSVASSSNQSAILARSLTMQLSPQKKMGSVKSNDEERKENNDSMLGNFSNHEGSSMGRVPFSWAEIAKIQPSFRSHPVLRAEEPGAAPVQKSGNNLNDLATPDLNRLAKMHQLQVRSNGPFNQKRKRRRGKRGQKKGGSSGSARLGTIPDEAITNPFEDVHATKADFGRTARRVGKTGSRVKRLKKRNRGKK